MKLALMQLSNPSSILSIQSSVVSGRVGNSAAAPIHAIFGQETLRIDSVILATHPGCMNSTKFITPARQIACLLEELSAITPSVRVDAIQTGYLGNAEQIDEINPFIKAHPRASYVYDPVFGDNDALYVEQHLADNSKTHLLPIASITTPNMFELSYLSQIKVSNIETAIAASRKIQQTGPKWVISTGIWASENEIADIITGPENSLIHRHKRRQTGISGAGDTLAAILTSLIVSGEPVATAASKACHITQFLIRQSDTNQLMPLLTTEMLENFSSHHLLD